MSSHPFLHRARAWFGITVLTFLTLGASVAAAQGDPPGRVGRLAELQGGVSWYDHEEGVWSEAERNRPLTGGDRLSTGPKGRAELRVGSTVLRLSAGTELEVLRLDDERMSFQLHVGSLAVRVRSRDVAEELEVLTPEVRFRPDRAGHYRFDRVDDTTQAGVWRGSLRVDDAAGFILETGQRAEFWREGRQARNLRFSWNQLPSDAFADWVSRDDQRDERSASSRYVSPEMTGAEELDRHGRWEQHNEYGAIWFPLEVRAGWAPYQQGRWAWVRPWGWTWVDEAPWGFAPFHYGRWVSYRGRWGWCPGDYVARPVYAPALVAWVGGPNLGISINIGGPTVGWVPLAPRERYVPHYRHTPVYIDRVNPHIRGRGYVPQVPTGPVMYSNQGVPGGVTVVPRDVLVNRQPVARGAIDNSEWQRARSRDPLIAVTPPEPERGRERPGDRDRDRPAGRLQPVPGGAQVVPAPDRRDVWQEPGRRPGAEPQPTVRPYPGASEANPPRPSVTVPTPAPAVGSGAAGIGPGFRNPPVTVAPAPVPPVASPPPAYVPQSPRERGGAGAGPGRQAPVEPSTSPAANPSAPVMVAPGRPPVTVQTRPVAPAPNAVPPSPPAPPAPPAQAAPPAAVPSPAAAPVRPAPPVAAPTVRPAPGPAPERAREREAEREQRTKDEDRKRGPDNRGGSARERENLR